MSLRMRAGSKKRSALPAGRALLCAMAIKKALTGVSAFCYARSQIARVTLPERRQRVQAYTWHGVPLTIAFTRLTFGFQALLDRLWEWETLMPKVTPLPQISHLAICCTSLPCRSITKIGRFEAPTAILADAGRKCNRNFPFFAFCFFETRLPNGIKADIIKKTG